MDEMNKYAPVLIATLNRYDHFKQCIESLGACKHAKYTNLFIALDYPLTSSHWSGYKKILEYINTINHFRTITLIKRTSNFGPQRNFLEARQFVFNKYDRLIISEDDNVFAPSFLEFVNTGLDVYESREDIFSVSGYNSPFPIPAWYEGDVYLRTGFTGWGVGVWRDKWNKVDWSLNGFNKMFSKNKIYSKLKRNYARYLPDLLKIRDTGIITGDGLLFLYLLDSNMYSIYPVQTRVRNTGCDGSGVHNGRSDKYMNQEYYKGLESVYFSPDLQEDKQLTKYILKQVSLPLSHKIKMAIPETFKSFLKRFLKKS
jgi:hypothetical protein